MLTTRTMRPPSLCASVLTLISLTAAQSVSFAAAQSLSFVRPRLNTFSTNNAGTPQLRAGDNITIEWDTNFQSTTLVVYQNIGRNLFQSEVLARTYICARNTYPIPKLTPACRSAAAG